MILEVYARSKVQDHKVSSRNMLEHSMDQKKISEAGAKEYRMKGQR